MVGISPIAAEGSPCRCKSRGGTIECKAVEGPVLPTDCVIVTHLKTGTVVGGLTVAEVAAGLQANKMTLDELLAELLKKDLFTVQSPETWEIKGRESIEVPIILTWWKDKEHTTVVKRLELMATLRRHADPEERPWYVEKYRTIAAYGFPSVIVILLLVLKFLPYLLIL